MQGRFKSIKFIESMGYYSEEINDIPNGKSFTVVFSNITGCEMEKGLFIL